MAHRNELTATPVFDLGRVRIAAPCGAAWDQMTGDARVRHCGSCDKHVYNLSEMTRDEAQALVVKLEGKLCARFYRRADGTMITSECRGGARRSPRLKVLAAAGAAVLATAGIAAAMVDRTVDPAPPERLDAPVVVPEPIAPPDPPLDISPVAVPHPGVVAMGVVSIHPAPSPPRIKDVKKLAP